MALENKETVNMSSIKVLNPYSLPDDFRAYVYDAVVLAWETKRVDIISSKFDKKILHSDCGLDVLMLDTLAEIQLREQNTLPAGEFLIFLRTDNGYTGLFKRLRDTFAHGHYGLNEQGWTTIRHRYQEKTRVFGNLQISTLKKLVAFLDTATGVREAA